MLISVIGGANIDLSAQLNGPFLGGDSNPGHVDIGYGGVARNIAQNLSLLGAQVQLLSTFGSDLFGGLIHDQCKRAGIDIRLCEQVQGERSGIYLCINNHSGEMIAAVADTDVAKHITPAWIEKRTG